MIRLDRNRHGGGILLYIIKSLTWEIILKGSYDLEFIALSVTSALTTVKHCVSVLYRPPSSLVSFFDNFCTALHRLSIQSFSSFTLLGDFNINFCNKSHPNFCKLENILQMFSLSQVVNTPTHTSPNGDTSLIDLAILSNTALLLDCSTIPPLMNSDHNGLKLSLRWKYKDRPPQQPRTIWRNGNADYRKACQLIDETDWDSLLPTDNLDLAADNWHNRIMDIMSVCIPQQTLKRKRNVPWLTKNIIRYIRKCNAVLQATKRHAKPALATKYKQLRNRVVKMLRNAKRSYFQQLNPRNKKQFWKAVKSLNKQPSTIPTLHAPSR